MEVYNKGRSKRDVRDALVWGEKGRQSVIKTIFIGVIPVGEVSNLSENRVSRHLFFLQCSK